MFNGFDNEGIRNFYEHIISLSPIKNFYPYYINILKTYKGKPKRKIWDKHDECWLPYTGAGACGYGSIVEKVYFKLTYRNINYEKHIYRTGLYFRGLVSNDSRTGGYIIKWKKGH